MDQRLDGEGEQTTLLVLRIHGYGTSEKVRNDHTKAAARALYREFGDMFELLMGGKLLKYDPLAHDGEHEGHDQIITEREWNDRLTGQASPSA